MEKRDNKQDTLYSIWNNGTVEKRASDGTEVVRRPLWKDHLK